MFEFLISFSKWITQSGTDSVLEDRLLFIAWVYLLFAFLITLFWPAPYGKFKHSTKQASLLESLTSLLIPATIGWMVQELPSFLIGLQAQAFFVERGMRAEILMLTPFIIHYFNRAVIFPLQLKKGKPTPVLTVINAFLFTLFNGLLQALSLLNQEQASISRERLGGLIVFILGMTINIHSDSTLRSLRTECTGYSIPRGGMFTFVSAPNYMGEIIEWWGFSLLVQTRASVWFALFTSLFLGLRATQTHKWYRNKFPEEYPQNRKAVIPFIL